MSIIYVASIGQTAATKHHYWTGAKERFKYNESVIVCSASLLETVSRFLDKNANLVIVEKPFYGTCGYAAAVEDVVKQVMDIIAAHANNGNMVDEIIVNTAGGTEKMSCIIKDAVDVIKGLFPYVTHVWGANRGYETVYTVKPNVVDELKAKFENRYIQPKSSPKQPVKSIQAIPTPVPEPEKPTVVIKKKRHKKAKQVVDPAIQAAKAQAEQRRKALRKEKRARLKQKQKEQNLAKIKQYYYFPPEEDDSLHNMNYST